MNTLSTSYPPIWALSTRCAFPGRGTVIGWSSLLNSIGCSDQCKYYVYTGGDVIAKLTWTWARVVSLPQCVPLMGYSLPRFDYPGFVVIARLQLTRVKLDNALDLGLRIEGRGLQMNSKVKV
jgi:hypothetical protein